MHLSVLEVEALPPWKFDRYLCVLIGKNKAEAAAMKSAGDSGSAKVGGDTMRERARAAFAALRTQRNGDEPE